MKNDVGIQFVMNAGNGERRTVSGERHVGGRSGFKLATRLNAFNRNRLGEGYLGFGLRTPFWPVFFFVCVYALCVVRWSDDGAAASEGTAWSTCR